MHACNVCMYVMYVCMFVCVCNVCVYVCIFLFIYYLFVCLFVHAQLLWSNTTFCKCTYYKISVSVQVMPRPTSSLFAQAAARPLQWQLVYK